MKQKYKIVYAKDYIELAKKVNANLEAGFVCQGGVAITISNKTINQDTSISIAQAMIYTEPEVTKDDQR